jgi:hypothetical protein
MIKLAAIIALALEIISKHFLIVATVIMGTMFANVVSMLYTYAVHNRIDIWVRESQACLEIYQNSLELVSRQLVFNEDHTFIDDGNITSDPRLVMTVESFSFSHQHLVLKICNRRTPHPNVSLPQPHL